MELIFSEPFNYKDKLFRLTLLHNNGVYPIRVFLNEKVAAEFETNLTAIQINAITTSKTVTEPLSKIFNQVKQWVSENV